MATEWRVLCVDDDAEQANEFKEWLEGETNPDESTVHVEVATAFDEALPAFEAGDVDILVLDVRRGDGPDADDEAGARTLAEVRARLFVPTVFHTALPGKVDDLRSKVVEVVEKGDPADLVAAIQRLLNTGLPSVNRALRKHLDTVQRDYMWEFVAANWDGLTAGGTNGLAQLLARRLAASLSAYDVGSFAEAIGGETEAIAPGMVIPELMYLAPPLPGFRRIGDVLRGNACDAEGYWVIVTPTCDLALKKADRVILANCSELSDRPEHIAWAADLPKASKEKTNTIRNFMRNQAGDRYHFLPGVLSIFPSLLVDFQHLCAIPTDKIDEVEVLATLDAPYAEALSARFSAYYARVGTPDLDEGVMFTRLLEATKPKE